MAFPCPIPLAAMVRLGQPWWLVAAVAGLVPALLAARGRKRGRDLPAVTVALQTAAILAVVLAAVRPEARIGPGARRGVLLLRDVSASCRGQSVGDVPLGDGLPVRRYDFAARLAPAGTRIDANATRLAPALRLAAAGRSDLAGVVVLTDGRFTDPADWPAAAAALGRTGLPVAILPLDSPPADARVAHLAAQRSPDGRVRLRADIAANGLLRRTCRLVRLRPGPPTVLLARSLELWPAAPATLRATDRPPADQAAAYRAELLKPDPFPENDRAEVLVLPARQRVALLGAVPLDEADLAGTLKPAVERLEPDSPRSSEDAWSAFGAVVLADADGTLLPSRSRAALERYVRAGGGLVLLGAGPHASPADRDDPLNRAAALLANPYERQPLCVTVVLDASGSMAERAEGASLSAGATKFDQAIEAVVALRPHLTAGDALEVIVFSDSARRAYAAQPGRVDFSAVRDALRAVRPAGPTDVAPALGEALAPSPPGGLGRLVLVVSDLQTRPFRPDHIAERFRSAEAALAVVAVGPGPTRPAGPSPLETLTRLLGAPLVRRESLAALAEVFAGFLKDRRGEALRTGRFQALAPAAIFDLPDATVPPVTAYLVSAPCPGSEVLAHLGAGGDPLLAVRRVGLGRSVTLALPPDPARNRRWHETGYLRRLLAAAVRWALRPAGDARFSGRVRRTRDALALRLDAADANGPMNLLALAGRALADDAPEPVPFTLAQTAPGRYEAEIPGLAGPVGLVVADSTGRVVWRGSAPAGAPEEFSAIGADWASLRSLARLTGGRIVSDLRQVSLPEGFGAAGWTRLWPVLLALGLALMLTEWASARLRRRQP